jgi:hypothetical protein
MGQRDAAGQRKVRLMSVWVVLGVVILVAGFFVSPWISLLGACIIGSTPVWFTLRMALAAPRRPPQQRYDVYGDDFMRMINRIPTGSQEGRRPPRRRRGHTGDERRPSE